MSKIKREIYALLTTPPPKLFTVSARERAGRLGRHRHLRRRRSVSLSPSLPPSLGSATPSPAGGSLMAVPVLIIGFGLAMPARTLKGAWMLNHVLGLREYIDRVDRERLKYVTLEHFEKLLPFAAAMGLEEKWTEAFETILIEPPGWYVSHHSGAFRAAPTSPTRWGRHDPARPARHWSRRRALGERRLGLQRWRWVFRAAGLAVEAEADSDVVANIGHRTSDIERGKHSRTFLR